MGAMRDNWSLTSIHLLDQSTRYKVPFGIFYRVDEELGQFVTRNTGMAGMNASVATGSVKGNALGVCQADLARRLLRAKFKIHPACFDAEGDCCFCEICHKKRSICSR